MVGVYGAKSGKFEQEIRAIMKAETWYDADGAVAAGFADEVARKEMKVAAVFDPEHFKGTFAKDPTGRLAALGITPKGSDSMRHNENEFMDPITEFEDAIEARMSPGKTKTAAMREVIVDRPDLHAAYIHAYNEAHGRGRRQGAAAPIVELPGVPPVGAGRMTAALRAGVFDPEDPETAWFEAIEAKVKRGMSKAQAVSAVVRENPDLHQAYLVAYNARFDRVVSE